MAKVVAVFVVITLTTVANSIVHTKNPVCCTPDQWEAHMFWDNGNAFIDAQSGTSTAPGVGTVITYINGSLTTAYDFTNGRTFINATIMQILDCMFRPVMVIELNLRASRSCPFVSKTIGIVFIATATRVMLGLPVNTAELPTLDNPQNPTDYVSMKAPMFSWPRLKDADPILKCEMASTGEVACFGRTKYTAFLKAMMSAGFRLPRPGSSIMVGVQNSFLSHFLPHAKRLHNLGYKIFATEKTVEYLNKHYIQAQEVSWPLLENGGCADHPSATKVIEDHTVDLVINLPNQETKHNTRDNYLIRRAAIDSAVPLVTNFEVVKLFVEALDYTGNIEADNLLDYYGLQASSNGSALKATADN